jgi:hypothetical protein
MEALHAFSKFYFGVAWTPIIAQIGYPLLIICWGCVAALVRAN